ncbi:MAG: tRNA dihydrouridine(20/20a) synthase DusA [Leptonema sp. (in: bacteria)]
MKLNLNRKISIAPMMNYTNRHFRYFFRLISTYPILYTEMIPATTLYYNLKNKEKLKEILELDPIEHPIFCQIGAYESKKLKEILAIIEEYQYDGINLNCGCPSEKVQKGNFGASLMLNQKPLLKLIETIKAKSKLPLSIKHRLGVEYKGIKTDYNYLKEFIKNCYNAGCEHFIIHSRFAIMNFDPKKNRVVPPLLYEWVYQLKHEFPFLNIELNGGIQNLEDIKKHLLHVDGVMIGRNAYFNPYQFIDLDNEFLKTNKKIPTRKEIFQKYYSYILKQIDNGIYPHRILPHTFGLFFNFPYSNKWKQFISDQMVKFKKYKIQEIPKEQILKILDDSLRIFQDEPLVQNVP